MGDDWATVCRHETVTMRVLARYETVLVSLDQLILSVTEVLNRARLCLARLCLISITYWSLCQSSHFMSGDSISTTIDLHKFCDDTAWSSIPPFRKPCNVLHGSIRHTQKILSMMRISFDKDTATLSGNLLHFSGTEFAS